MIIKLVVKVEPRSLTIYIFGLLTTVKICASFNGRGPVSGQTPCCTDKLTTIICQRQKNQNSALFLYKCMQNSDYAFVQCCQTCFDRSSDDTFQLDYQKTSEFLLTNPITAQCDDRRGPQWCEQFVNSRLRWNNKHTRAKMDCSNVPIAFRLCRKSCGYCATKDIPAQAVYSYPLAKDAFRCYNPAKGLAQRKQNMKSFYEEFAKRFARAKTHTEPVDSEKPSDNGNGNENQNSYEDESSFSRAKAHSYTSSSNNNEDATHSPHDYFVVTNHNYEDYDN